MSYKQIQFLKVFNSPWYKLLVYSNNAHYLFIYLFIYYQRPARFFYKLNWLIKPLHLNAFPANHQNLMLRTNAISYISWFAMYSWHTRKALVWVKLNHRVIACYKVFNSPKPKVQVSLSEHPLSVVRQSVCPSINFSHF